MKYLLDASALLPIVTKRGRRLIEDASTEDLATTDLAIYEACNTLWKLSTLLKALSPEEAQDTAAILREVALRNLIQLVTVTKLDLGAILKRAGEERLSFYDASYAVAAEDMKAILVTEDEKLKKIANKLVKTIAYKDLENRLTTS
ncbi:MAG: type II toxin-antitoxin system VapC family toxin [Candidatus Bathyarchaeia archaeon]